MTWLARRSALTQCVLAILFILFVAGAIDAVSAAPFGAGGGGAPQVGGFTGWVLAQQASFYRMLSGAIRASKADGSAAWTLLGISFAYGVFHAAGPGHGKAVISSYLVANDETWKRGIALSFASAILQAITAIVIVGIAAVLLNATRRSWVTPCGWSRWSLRADYPDRSAVAVGEGPAFLKLLLPQNADGHAHHDMRITGIHMIIRMVIRMVIRHDHRGHSMITRTIITTIATKRMPGAMSMRRNRPN